MARPAHDVIAERRRAAQASSGVVDREPPVMTEVAVSGLLHQPHELLPADADQTLVITRLEIDLRLLGQTVVDDGVHAVGGAERRDRAALTILEQGADLLLGGEAKTAIQLPAQSPQPAAPRGTQHGP